MKKLFTLVFAMCFGTLLMGQFYTEDFEGGIPGDWTVGQYWAHGETGDISSQYFAPPAHTQFIALNDDALGQDEVVTSLIHSGEIDLTDAVSPILTFEAYFLNLDFQGADETAKVMVSTDGGATWDEVKSIDGDGDWYGEQVSLGAYAGETIWLGFEYSDGTGWNYGFCVDDIMIEDFTTMNDAKMTFAQVSCPGGAVGVDVSVSGTFRNEGINTITSIDVNWSDGTNTYTETLSGLSVPSFESYNFEMSDMTSLDLAPKMLDVWVSNMNGIGDDEDPSNDGAPTLTLQGVELEPGRGVLVEEATGTWCPWCPRGTVWMDRMTRCYGDNFVGVAVHNQDPMMVTEYDNGVTSFPGFTGFPSVIMERDQVLDPSEIEAPTVSRASETPDAYLSLGAEYDAGSGMLTVTATAMPTMNLSGDYKLNVVLTEDGVTGTSSSYDQYNNYAGGGFGPMGGYENLPNPVPAAMMVYDHTARALLGGFNGVAGSLPADMTADEAYSHTFDATNISAWNYDNIHIVVILHGPGGNVVNAWSETIDEAMANNTNDVVINNDLARVSPNPFSDVTNIHLSLDQPQEVSLTVMNAVGQVVATREYGTLNGEMILPFDGSNLQAGMYLLHLKVDNTIVTKKVMLTK